MRSKKLLICLVFLFVSLFAFGFNAKINAIETSDAITVIGAQVRTTGNAGIRFVANETYEGEDSYGILLAFGETEANEEFVVGGTVNGKVVADAQVATAEDGVFKVTLYNIPEVYYTQAISARAYVKVGENYVYSSTVCVKSLAEVALKGKANGEEGTLIEDVNEYVFANYKYYGTLNEKVALVDLPLVSSLEVANLEAEFIADVNEFLGLSLTVNSTYKEFVSALAGDQTYKLDVTNVNVYKFFNDVEMGAKWRWIAEYLVDKGTTHPKNQAYEILDDGIYNSREVDGLVLNNLRGLEHFASALYVILNAENQKYTAINSLGLSMDFTDSSKYEVVNQYYLDSVAAKLEGLVKVGDKVTLPAALEKVGYTWAGWTDGINTLAAGSEYTVTNDDLKLSADFDVIQYTITYNDESEQTTAKYTVEAAVTLPTPEKTGKQFLGWYENAEFTGEAVATIAKGTTGDKVFYAKWAEGYDALVVDDDYASMASGTKVTVNEVEYTVGFDAQATIANALLYANEGATINVAAGTYADALTITKSVNIIGVNKELVLAHDSTYTSSSANDSIISGYVKLQSGANNVSIKGFVMKDHVVLYGNDTVEVSYIYFENPGSSLKDKAGAVVVDGISSNLTVDHVYYVGNLYRFVNIYYQLTNLTVTNSVIMDGSTSLSDGIRVQNSVKVLGTYTAQYNYLQLCTQAAIFSRNTYVGCEYIITDNVFANGGGVYFRYCDAGGIKFTVSYNTFDTYGLNTDDYYAIQINSYTGSVKTESIIRINYNKFIAGVTDAISIRYALADCDCSNNYFDSTGDITCTNATNSDQVAEESACGPRQ